jgi:hypothetical protein
MEDKITLQSGKNSSTFMTEYVQSFTSVSKFIEAHITNASWYTEAFLNDIYTIATKKENTKAENPKTAQKSADKSKD